VAPANGAEVGDPLACLSFEAPTARSLRYSFTSFGAVVGTTVKDFVPRKTRSWVHCSIRLK
jgi:hypothetical protein